MKLKNFEIGLIACALLAVSFCSGFFLGRGTQREVSVKVSAQIDPADNTAALPESGGAENTDAPNTELVNINTAGIDELMTLPKIGQVLAERIIVYREENGNFSAVEEILGVYGIGEGIYEGICELITVG
ncbi:MAG: ComEA family DNA-binding protein [Oscillospiraceae bacterium]